MAIKDYLLTTKAFAAMFVPLGIVLIQALLRYAMNEDFDSLGITLSSIGIGQIFPVIIFENFLLSKVFGIKEEIIQDGGTTSIVHKLEQKEVTSSIKDIRLYSYIVLLINLLLFMLTIILNLKGNACLHIVTGCLSCLVTWYYTIRY
jgi:hypothetical protein